MGSACATIGHAYDLLDGFAYPNYGGEIDVCDSQLNVWADPNHAVGIYIMGSTDPNYANPPSGWHKQMNVKIKGVCGNYGGRDYVQANYIKIWLSSFVVNQGTLEIDNLDMRYGPVKLGVDSNGAQTTTSGLFAANSPNGVVFNNDNFILCNGSCAPTDGPGFFIGGGSQTYGVVINDTSIGGNPNATPGSDNQAALLIKPTSTGDTFVTVNDSWLDLGELKWYPGNGGGNALTVNNLALEGVQGGTAGVGAVWEADGSGVFLSDLLSVNGVENDDCGGTCYDVRFDDTVHANASITLRNVSSVYSPQARQGSISISGTVSHYGGKDGVGDPIAQGQNESSSGRTFNFTGQAQRQFGPTMVRYANLASICPNGASVIPCSGSGPNPWATFGSSSSLSTGTVDNAGGTNAATGSTTNALAQCCGVTLYSASNALSVGQYFIGGFWYKADSLQGPYDAGGAQQTPLSIGGTGNTASCKELTSLVWPTEEWQWLWELCKLTAVVTTPATINLSVFDSPNLSVDIFAPMVITIPAGSVTDDEAYEIGNNLVSYATNCSVGALCGMGGPINASAFLPTVLYSAAGTPLPSCAVGIKGEKAVVSDATAPTYMTAYTSGGAVTSSVICSYNGSTYFWLTD
jgi:hypothetical protein